MRGCLGDEIEVLIVDVEKIQRTPTGKFLFVVNEVRKCQNSSWINITQAWLQNPTLLVV